LSGLASKGSDSAVGAEADITGEDEGAGAAVEETSG